MNWRLDIEYDGSAFRGWAKQEGSVDTVQARLEETSQKVRGEGDATSIKVYAEAYGKDPEFYAFTRSLDAYEKSVDDKSTVVLSSGSDLFRYFGQPKP